MIGQITINVSLILYLLLAIFQLKHNLIAKKITGLSFGFHALLLISATADLYYGFWFIQQWQYRVVSLVFFGFLLMQHIQLFIHYPRSISLTILSIAVFVMLLGLLLLPHNDTFSLTMGWIERIGYWLYAFPQAMKNKKNPLATESISKGFAVTGLLAALCDVVSALYFSWGSPGVYGGVVALILQAYLLRQCFRFNMPTA